MPEKSEKEEKDIHIDGIFVILICATLIIIYIISGEYALRLETLRGEFALRH